MSKLRLSRLICVSGTLAALAFAVPAVPAAAQVVVRSLGSIAAAYPAGRRLGPNEAVRLRAGDRLTVLDTRGTRVISGPTVYRAGARRVEQPRLIATWRQQGRRVRIASVRGPEQIEADRRAGLVGNALDAVNAGQLDRAQGLLDEVERLGFSQRVQCAVVRNARLYLLVAQGRGAEIATREDGCTALPIPRNLRDLMTELDGEAEQIKAAVAGENAA